MAKKIYSTFQIKAIVYSFSNKEIIFWLILNSHFSPTPYYGNVIKRNITKCLNIKTY
ncbi:hypothetical protein [Clostridium botulinum]|uniref:hypothetical protein n=1 Tax=Clostridium botulinum TaxID=1491 RepID=UPI0013905DDF|nr:hypothetical protein [Clostridium botulinum]